MPPWPLAIWRTIATVPIRWRSSGVGSSLSFFCSSSSTIRSPAKALFTASTEIGRLTPSGATVIGKTTAPRSGTTGNSLGSGGVCVVSAISVFASLRPFGDTLLKSRTCGGRLAIANRTDDLAPSTRRRGSQSFVSWQGMIRSTCLVW